MSTLNNKIEYFATYGVKSSLERAILRRFGYKGDGLFNELKRAMSQSENLHCIDLKDIPLKDEIVNNDIDFFDEFIHFLISMKYFDKQIFDEFLVLQSNRFIKSKTVQDVYQKRESAKKGSKLKGPAITDFLKRHSVYDFLKKTGGVFEDWEDLEIFQNTEKSDDFQNPKNGGISCVETEKEQKELEQAGTVWNPKRKAKEKHRKEKKQAKKSGELSKLTDCFLPASFKNLNEDLIDLVSKSTDIRIQNGHIVKNKKGYILTLVRACEEDPSEVEKHKILIEKHEKDLILKAKQAEANRIFELKQAQQEAEENKRRSKTEEARNWIKTLPEDVRIAIEGKIEKERWNIMGGVAKAPKCVAERAVYEREVLYA